MNIVTLVDMVDPWLRGGPRLSPTVVYVLQWWPVDNHGLPPTDVATRETTDEHPAVARVNHARWIADCASPWCSNAQYVDPDEQRFFCVSCANAHVGGRWVRVVLPDDSERREIEAALSVRPSPAVANWEPGQTLDDLRAENVEQGVPA